MPQKHIYIEDGIYFIAVNVESRLPFFKSKILCDLWIEELKFGKAVKKFSLFSFCLNHDHFHLLTRPGKDSNISETMRSFKANFSRNANRILVANFEPFPEKLEQRSRDRCCKEEEINVHEYESKIRKWHTQFHQQFPNYTSPKFKWQKGFYDQITRGEKDFLDRHNYCENNFLKHELPPDWAYTSLHYPELLDTL